MKPQTTLHKWLAVAVFLTATLFSQASNLEWAKSINVKGVGWANPQLLPSKDGGLLAVITGQSLDTLDVDLNSGFENAVIAGGTHQFSLIKYDLTGNLQWHKTWTSVGADYLGLNSWAERPSDGHIFLYGWFESVMNGDPTGGAGGILTTGAVPAIFLIELDSQGGYVWAGKLSPSDNGCMPVGVAINSSGNIILTGTNGSVIDLDFFSTTNSAAVTFQSTNSFIATYNPDHQLIWFGGLNSQGVATTKITNVEVNPFTNDIYVSGTLYGTANFNLISGTTNSSSTSNQDAFIAHYDSSGNYQEVRILGSVGAVVPTGLHFIQGAGLTFTGNVSGSVNLDPLGSGHIVSSPDGSTPYGFVAEYGINLSLIWAKNFSSTNGDIQISSPKFDYETGVSIVVHSDLPFDITTGSGTTTVDVSNSDAVVLLDYYSGEYLNHFNYIGLSGSILNTAARYGSLYIAGSFKNGFNAGLNGASVVLQNPYNTGSATSPFLAAYNFWAVQPTVQTSNLHFIPGDSTQVTVTFTPGNGERRLLMILEDSAITDYPTNGYVDYFYDTAYLDFDAYQYPNGAYGVYLDSGQQVTLTGIDTTGGHKYYFKAFEVSGSPQFANFLLANAPTAVYPEVATTGLVEAPDAQVTLYPNPVKNFLMLHFGRDMENTTATVTDLSGRILLEKPLSSSTEKLDVSQLPSGCYTVHIKAQNNYAVKKFMKQ